MAVDWQDILLAYLHDPPDKALAVSGQGQVPSHESRGLDLAKALLGSDAVSKKKIKKITGEVDRRAAQAERLPLPKRQHVNVQNGRLTITHPLAAGGAEGSISLCVPRWDESFFIAERGELLRVADDLSRPFHRFLAVWRLWPDGLTGKVDPCFARLPADTRTPDHTIWNHLDITAAFKAAEGEGQGEGASLLVFALGPVQRFIEAARSVRDLWSGSMVLSWLAFRGMLPIIERLGPTALVYPALRGNPLLDLWLRDKQGLGSKVDLPDLQRRRAPSLPHRFLALVPCGTKGSTAKALAAECRKAAMSGWQEMANAVRQRVKGKLDPLFADWDKRWDDQIGQYFSTTSAVLPLAGPSEEIDKLLARLLAGNDSFVKAFKDAEAVRGMARSIPASDRPGYPQDHAGRWQYQVELANRSLAAQRAIRYVPANPCNAGSNERFPQKCTLLGTFEQMGPDDLAQSNEFWEKAADSQSGLSVDSVRLRGGEALCAVAMVKRFAGPSFLAQQLWVQPAELRFPDTWTVAAAEWLDQAGMAPDSIRRQHRHWNGQWLHPSTGQDHPDEPRCPNTVLDDVETARSRLGKPPVYYAILKLDGDDLGGWLRGEKSPRVREGMHPDLVRYYEGLGNAAKKGLDARRPVGPALHQAISTALANFALHAVPDIVRRHYGTTIYSGGDDTLVVLPASSALACALELRKAYMNNWWHADDQRSQGGHTREYLMMGPRATLSAGLVIVHAKDDLRLALQDARRAEKQAKEAGKDAFVIRVRRRRGEHSSALCPWQFVSAVESWRKAFLPKDGDPGASDRWAYHLKAEAPTLAGLKPDAIRSEIRRQVNRAERLTRRRLGEPERPKEGERAGHILAAQFEQYHKTAANDQRKFDRPRALGEWLTLCQTASFMARGRDS